MAYSSQMKMEAKASYKILESIYHTTQEHKEADGTLHSQSHENPIS